MAGYGPQQNPGPPFWTTHISVADAEGTAKKPPMDVPVGRFAVLADPQGATSAVIRLAERGV